MTAGLRGVLSKVSGERFELYGSVESLGVLRCAQDDGKNLEQKQILLFAKDDN